MSLPRDLTPFVDLNLDCTKLILAQLSQFDQSNLAVTAKHFDRAVDIYRIENKNKSHYFQFDAHLKRLFGNEFVWSFEDCKKLNLSNDDFYSFCTFVHSDVYLNMEFLHWLTTDEIIKNNSLIFWHIAMTQIARCLKAYGLSNKINVTHENLTTMKGVVRQVLEIQRSIAGRPLVVMTQIRELYELDNEKGGWIECIAERLFINLIQRWGKVNGDRLQLQAALVFSDEKAFCLEKLGDIQEKFTNDLSVFSQYVNDDNKKEILKKNWLDGKRLPGNFATMMAAVNKMRCLDLLLSLNVHDVSTMMRNAEIILFLERIGLEEAFIKLLMQKYEGHEDKELHNQVGSLIDLIASFPFALHSHHKKVLFLHLFKFQDFEKYKESYRRYFNSAAKLELNAGLNKIIMTLLEHSFSLSNAEDVGEFLDVIVRKSFAPADFWNGLCAKYENDISMAFFAVSMLADIESYDAATLEAIEFLYDCDYVYFRPSRLRGLLNIKQNNNLWLNDENNRSWFFEQKVQDRFGDAEELGSDYQGEFLDAVARSPHMPTRLNQLAAFDVVLSVIGRSLNFGDKGVSLCDILLALPDRLYNLTLIKLQKLKKDVKEQKNPDSFALNRLVKQQLWFLKPFTSYPVNFFSEKLNAFFNRLSVEQLRDMIGLPNQPTTMLSTIISHYSCFNLTAEMRNLYLRFIGLVFETPHPLAIDKYNEFLLLATQHRWFEMRKN